MGSYLNILYFDIIMLEKLKKREVKIGEVQREKIASKLEEVMCRFCCIDFGNDFS